MIPLDNRLRRFPLAMLAQSGGALKIICINGTRLGHGLRGYLRFIGVEKVPEGTTESSAG